MLSSTRNPVRIVQMCGLAVGLAATLCAQPSVLTWHNDNARTGQNLQETILTPANVNTTSFGKLFSMGVDGKVDAQPLYVPHLTIPGQGVHNVLYVATEHDSVYAFDADSGAPLLHVSLLEPREATSDDRSCGSQVGPEIGVTATPVIDTASGPHGTIYVVGMTKDQSNNYHHRLHALDLTTLSEQFNGPVEVVATYPGNLGTEKKHAADSIQTFLPAQHKERAALLFLNGVVYTAWSSHCDSPPYTSWIIGYNATTLAQSTVLNLVPNGNDGGIWAAGSGLQADNAGNIYVPTGNGTFDTSLTGGGFPSKNNYGNAYVKMATSGGNLAVTDYFTMTNTVSESGVDTDLGSGGGMLLPPLMDAGGHSRDLAVVAGKDQNIYVMDRTNLGKFHPSSDEIFQKLEGVLAGGMWSSPAWFNNVLYYGAQGNVLKGFQFANGKFLANPISQTSPTFQYPGTTPSISANGTSNGIVWATSNGTAVLHAFSASNLGNELYNSNQNASGRDHFGAGNKFMVPTIVNGKVYVGSNNGVAGFAGSVTAFGNLGPLIDPPADFSFTVTPNSISVVPGGTAPYTITLVPNNGFTGTVTFNLTGLPAGASAVISPQMVTGSGTTSLMITATGVAMGSHTFTVTGSSGSITHNVAATLIVTGSTSDLAQNRIATQSSTLVPGTTDASKAVDGNTDGIYADGSLTHTNQNANAWWQVDLGTSAVVGSIVVWNRTDCCGARLSDYWVFVSDTPFGPSDTPATLQNRAGTWSSHQTVQPNPSATIAVPAAQGRYVRVQLSGTNYLSLAEVQVLAAQDLAQNKAAAQSSTYAPGTTDASKAVDGNTDGVYAHGSLAHTNLDANAWWQVDLGSSAPVSSIVVWNRTDCCGARLSDYWVFVSNTPFGPTDTPATLQVRAGTFSSHQTVQPNPSARIAIPGAQGRYVRVQLSGTNYLALAEVQVFSLDIAKNKIATQSSTYAPGTTDASKAVDGNTDGIYADGSLSHTNLDANAWWQVDLGGSDAVSSIVVWNRTDCCGSRLTDYWVFVSDTPFGPSDTPATLQGRAGTSSSHQTVQPNPSTTITIPGAQGRYVRVQLSATGYLALAEVQVFGQ